MTRHFTKHGYFGSGRGHGPENENILRKRVASDLADQTAQYGPSEMPARPGTSLKLKVARTGWTSHQAAPLPMDDPTTIKEASPNEAPLVEKHCQDSACDGLLYYEYPVGAQGYSIEHCPKCKKSCAILKLNVAD